MNQPAQTFAKVNNSVSNLVERITTGAHSAPEAGAVGINTVPSRHRLYNAAGGIGLWIVGRYIMDVLVGETPKGVKIEKDKLPEPIRPLCGILHYNRYADDPHNQWMRVMDDLTPAILGSVGAVLGSQYFFAAKESAMVKAVGWGTKHHSMETMLADKTIPMLAKDNFKALQQAKTWRVLSGIAGVFAASSGMALLVAPINILNYGTSLNNAFALANGVVPGAALFKSKPLRWIFNNVADTTHAPSLAAKAIANNVGNCVAELASLEKLVSVEGVTAHNIGRVNTFCDAIVHKLFPKVTEKGAQRFKKEVMDTVAKAVRESSSKAPQEMGKHVQNALEDLLVKGHGLDKTFARLSSEIGKENFGEIAYGNHGFASWLGDHPKTAYGISGAALLSVDELGDQATKAFQRSAHQDVSGKAREDIGTPNLAPELSPDGKPIPAPASALDSPAMQACNAPKQDKGFVNGTLLDAGRWLSDSVLNVPPQNRLFSAIGLSGGLWVGYRGMRALAGKDFNGAPLAKDAKMDPILKWVAEKAQKAGMGLNFKYFVHTPDNRIKRAAFWLVPTLTAMAGTYMGSKYAFRDYYKKLEHPEFLEDYTAKIAMTQGDKWGWLLSSAAVMASASGFSNLPIPGINYSIGLSTRSVLSYDKKVTMPGMKWWSNNKSDYYFGTKGALNYTIEYAVRNPAEFPVEMAALAKATLEPLFPDVKPEQIAHYVNMIQEVRHRHWREGEGIPQAEQAIARKELKAMLRKRGFEKTLEAIGLDPAKAVFDNGMAGKIADTLGSKKHVEQLAEEYREKFRNRQQGIETPAPHKEHEEGHRFFAGLIAPPEPGSDARPKHNGFIDGLIAPPEPSAHAEDAAHHGPSFTTNSSTLMGSAMRTESVNRLVHKEEKPSSWRQSIGQQQSDPSLLALAK